MFDKFWIALFATILLASSKWKEQLKELEYMILPKSIIIAIPTRFVYLKGLGDAFLCILFFIAGCCWFVLFACFLFMYEARLL